MAVENVCLTVKSPPDSRKRERSIESLVMTRKTETPFGPRANFSFYLYVSYICTVWQLFGNHRFCKLFHLKM